MAIAFSTCPLCEATCGLQITVDRRRGDRHPRRRRRRLQPRLHLPEGRVAQELHEDPDRLRTPARSASPTATCARRRGTRRSPRSTAACPPIQAEHGRDAVAAYLGNPTRPQPRARCSTAASLLKALRTRNIFSASTVDQYPKQMASALMFGSGVDGRRARRRPHRPPAHPRRQPAGLQRQPAHGARHARAAARDPRARRQGRRHRPAAHAHRARGRRAPLHPPGHRRAAALRAGAHAVRRGPRPTRARSPTHVAGLDEVRALAARASRPRPSAATCGDRSAATIRRMARELAAAPTRRGLRADRHHDAGFGTTRELARRRAQRPHRQPRPPGRRDVPARRGRRRRTRRRARARPRRAPSGAGTAACAGWARSSASCRSPCLAEEIETPGEGQVRALITVAGNPARRARRTATAWPRRSSALDFMVSVDIYVNETTRHADVILPGALAAASARTTTSRSRLRRAQRRQLLAAGARARPPTRRPSGRRCCASPASSPARAPNADVAAIDDFVALETARRADRRRALARPRPRPRGAAGRGRAAGRARADARPAAAQRALRGLTLADARGRRPHGIDLGPLEPRVPEVLRTPSGKIELAPEPLVADVARLHEALAEPANGGMVLVGRRDLRSNNSWMHNLPMLVSGKQRCTAHVHPDDAARLGLADGEPARRALARRRGRRARRGHRRRHARRRLDPARLGPRPAGSATSASPASTPGRTPTCSPTSWRSSRSRAPRSSTASRSSSRPLLSVAAYRIVQEALTNALKHAGTARADVPVRYAAGTHRARRSSTTAPAARHVYCDGGHGLLGMRERVALYGGILEVGARGRGGGFRVHAVSSRSAERPRVITVVARRRPGHRSLGFALASLLPIPRSASSARPPTASPSYLLFLALLHPYFFPHLHPHSLSLLSLLHSPSHLLSSLPAAPRVDGSGRSP